MGPSLPQLAPFRARSAGFVTQGGKLRCWRIDRAIPTIAPPCISSHPVNYPDPLRSDKPLIVYLDVKSPYAFVAIKPTLAMMDRLGIPVDWRPLTLDIPSYLGSAKKSGGKVVESRRSASQWAAVKYAYRDARRYAERQGHELHGTEKIWDSSLPNMGISWVNHHQAQSMADYLAAVYPRFWRRDLDIESLDTVIGCMQGAGIDTGGFVGYCQGEGRKQHDALQAQLLDAGIYGVPSYVFADQVLFGRENLPYVEWYLGGRVGSAPDIGLPPS